jgi:hypothetical protein
MALRGIGLSPSVENVEVVYFRSNLSTRLIRHSPMRFTGKPFNSNQRQYSGVQCSLARKAGSSIESKEDARIALSGSVEEELEHVTRFKISDFKILDCISVGLGGRVWKFKFIICLCSNGCS